MLYCSGIREKAPIEITEKVKRMTLHDNKVKNIIKLKTSWGGGKRGKCKMGKIELNGCVKMMKGFG